MSYNYHHIMNTCNSDILKKTYYYNLKNEIKTINTLCKSISFVEKENKIHIIVRTHLREVNFNNVINSIIKQDYKNYIIHIVYDHEDSLIYIKKYLKIHTITNNVLHKVERRSDKIVFFDLYCNDIKEQINDGWIMFLDDDNCFIHNCCLKLINNFMRNTNIVVWYFLRPDKIIKPNLSSLKYGDIDNCSYIFHHSIKNSGHFGDFYGSDFTFIAKLISKHSAKLINYTLVLTQYNDKISNAYMYAKKSKKKYIDINRIDFIDYKNHYNDLNKLNIKQLKNHYMKYGRITSRVVKFLDFNYNIFKETINNYLTYYKSSLKFTLVITLYNERSDIRLNEYIISLKHNEKNQFIEKIIVFYDISNGKNNKLEEIFTTLKKVEIIECNSRPHFIDMFDLSNKFINKHIIISNADIIFDHTLYKIEEKNMQNTIYALTRWDFIDEKTPVPRCQNNKIMNSSKDSWIFKTPFNLSELQNNEEFKKIKIGTWNCDGALNYFFKDKLIHECLNIKSYHVHFCNERTYKDAKILYS